MPATRWWGLAGCSREKDQGSPRFVLEHGISEDEATGATAVALCTRLGRPIEIHQGRGSLILARPLPDGMVEIGGRVELDEMRDYARPE